MFIPYDIVDMIIGYLDITHTKNFLLSSSLIYHNFYGSKHFYIVMIKKIRDYFPSLSKINLEYLSLSDNEIKTLYRTMNKFYNHFKTHKNATLADFLIYLCEEQEKPLFEMIISHCYFSKTGEYIYNALRADDLSYLLMFYEEIPIITKYIYVDALIILNVIKFKILNKQVRDINFLMNYMLFKHFFRYSSYIDDILTEIVCEIIKSNNIENLQVLKMLYSKRKFYRFRLNRQKIINACMQQKHADIIVLIHKEMDDDTTPLIINKDYIRLLMKNRYYKVLDKVIELYLRDIVNLKGYVDEIYYNFDENNNECKKLLRFLSEKNRRRFKIK